MRAGDGRSRFLSDFGWPQFDVKPTGALSKDTGSPGADREEPRKTGQRARRDVNVDDLPEPQVREVNAVTLVPMARLLHHRQLPLGRPGTDSVPIDPPCSTGR